MGGCWAGCVLFYEELGLGQGDGAGWAMVVYDLQDVLAAYLVFFATVQQVEC